MHKIVVIRRRSGVFVVGCLFMLAAAATYFSALHLLQMPYFAIAVAQVSLMFGFFTLRYAAFHAAPESHWPLTALHLGTTVTWVVFVIGIARAIEVLGAAGAAVFFLVLGCFAGTSFVYYREAESYQLWPLKDALRLMFAGLAFGMLGISLVFTTVRPLVAASVIVIGWILMRFGRTIDVRGYALQSRFFEQRRFKRTMVYRLCSAALAASLLVRFPGESRPPQTTEALIFLGGAVTIIFATYREKER